MVSNSRIQHNVALSNFLEFKRYFYAYIRFLRKDKNRQILYRIFDTFYFFKTDKNGFAKFFVFAKIFAKNVCPRSR